jgi:glycosyltransferase involved in cell wall biosynthesis
MTEQTLREVLIHEQAHVRGWHTLDILFSQLVCILFWWNPAAWLMRREVRMNLEFIADKDINVVPLLSGSGIRVKIIEAMSVGKVVVATTVAAHGIDYTDGKDLLIADSPADFARQIKRCLIDREFCHSVGEAARKLISERYNGQHLTEELMEFYRKLTIEN